MEEEIERALQICGRVREMLDGIPNQLWDIFIPKGATEFMATGENLAHFAPRQKEREVVMTLQKMNGLPPRPNASLPETIAQIKIAQWKRRRDRLPRGTSDRDW